MFAELLIVAASFFAAVAPEDVRPLIRELGSPALAKREAAEQKLLDLGPEILPILPKSASNPEANLRLNRVRGRLEKLSSENSLAPGTFTISERIPFAQALDEISRQTGNPLASDLQGEEWEIPLTPGKTYEFWSGLDALCDGLRLVPQPRGERQQLVLVKSFRQSPRSASQNGLVSYLGPFRLEATKMTSTILLESRKSASQLQLELSWEPRVLPIFAEITLDEMELQDSEGQKRILKLVPRMNEILVGSRDIRTTIDAPLAGFAQETAKSAESVDIRGKLSAVVAGESTNFELDDLPSRVGKEFQPVSYHKAAVLVTFSALRRETVTDAEGGTKTYLVVSARYRYEEAHEAMESHRTWVYDNYARLENTADSNQPPVESDHSELLRQTSNELAVDIYFPETDEIRENLADWKIVFPRPCGLYRVEYEFCLKSIPIP